MDGLLHITLDIGDNVHCDDLIDDPEAPEALRAYLAVQRLPAVEKMGLVTPSLFARIKTGMSHKGIDWAAGEWVRVVMASRFGDLGITKDLNAEYGYSLRLFPNELTDYRSEPPCL